MAFYEHNGIVYDEDGNRIGRVPEQGEKPTPASANLPQTLNVAGFDTGIPLNENISAALVGAGSELNRLGKGIMQPFMSEEAKADFEQEQQYMEPLSQEMPWSTNIGRALPYVATAPLSGGLGTQMAIGGGMGGMGYGDAEERIKGMLFGGGGAGVGYGLGNMSSRVIKALRGMKSARSGAAGQLAQRADDLGFKLSPGQRTGNEVAQGLEATANANPLLMDIAGKMKGKNNAQLSKILTKAMGQKPQSEITGTVLDEARRQIGGQLDDIAARSTAQFDDASLGALNEISAQSTKGIARPQEINTYIERLMGMADESGTISGNNLLKARSDLAKLGSDAWKQGNSTLGQALNDVEDVVVDMIGRGLSPDDMAKYAQARQQWKIYRAVVDSKPDAGKISPTKIRSNLARADKTGYTLGQNTSEAYDAIRVATGFPDIVGDSGTATRNFLDLISPQKAATIMAGRPLYSNYMQGGLLGRMAMLPGSEAAGSGGASAGLGVSQGDLMEYLTRER